MAGNFVKLKEAARLCGTTNATLINAIKRGDLKGRRYRKRGADGREYYEMDLDDLTAWDTKRRSKPSMKESVRESLAINAVIRSNTAESPKSPMRGTYMETWGPEGEANRKKFTNNGQMDAKAYTSQEVTTKGDEIIKTIAKFGGIPTSKEEVMETKQQDLYEKTANGKINLTMTVQLPFVVALTSSVAQTFIAMNDTRYSKVEVKNGEFCTDDLQGKVKMHLHIPMGTVVKVDSLITDRRICLYTDDLTPVAGRFFVKPLDVTNDTSMAGKTASDFGFNIK